MIWQENSNRQHFILDRRINFVKTGFSFMVLATNGNIFTKMDSFVQNKIVGPEVVSATDVSHHDTSMVKITSGPTILFWTNDQFS